MKAILIFQLHKTISGEETHFPSSFKLLRSGYTGGSTETCVQMKDLCPPLWWILPHGSQKFKQLFDTFHTS